MEDLDAARAFFCATDWVSLATVAADGSPAVSYVPFAPVDGRLGIVVSSLSAHTAHLAARPRATLLIVGDRAPDGDPFARPRLSVDVIVHDQTGSSRAGAVWDALARSNGPTADVLRMLPDFRPLLLEPVRGRLILGFARATDLDAEALASILTTAT